MEHAKRKEGLGKSEISDGRCLAGALMAEVKNSGGHTRHTKDGIGEWHVTTLLYSGHTHTPILFWLKSSTPKFWVSILLNHAWSEMVWHNFLNTKASNLKHISLLYTFSLMWNRIPVLINSQKLSFPSLKSLNLSFLGPRFVFILGLGFHDNRCITMHFCILLVFSQFTRIETDEQMNY